MIKSPWKMAMLKSLPGLLIVLGWELLVLFVPEYRFFLGHPIGIIREGLSLVAGGTLARDISVTGMEALLGFLAGSILGTVVGLSMWTSENIYIIARPYLVALGSVPVFALGPVLIFWFGTGMLSKIVLGFLATFVVAIVQAYTGAKETHQHLLWVIQAFGGSRRDMFYKVVVPSATIWVLSGVRLNIGMALLGAFVGEFISSRMGLGHMIIVAEGLYNVNQIWVGCFCIVVLAILFHALTSPIEIWAKRWR